MRWHELGIHYWCPYYIGPLEGTPVQRLKILMMTIFREKFEIPKSPGSGNAGYLMPVTMKYPLMWCVTPYSRLCIYWITNPIDQYLIHELCTAPRPPPILQLWPLLVFNLPFFLIISLSTGRTAQLKFISTNIIFILYYHNPQPQ